MSELRQDIVSGDWIVIAPGRAARPDFLSVKKVRKPSPVSTCPFENLTTAASLPPLLTYPNAKDWKIALIPNKYPAMMRGNICSQLSRHGIYDVRTAIGNHDLLITRDHNKNFAELDKKTAAKIFEILQALHIMASHDKCAMYVSSFGNWGPSAGASVWHPHYQILTLPILPPHIEHSLRGAATYYRKHKRCVRCDLLAAERSDGTRIIEENEHAIAIAPFASKKPFEVSILPKAHAVSFRESAAPVIGDMALLLQSVMKRLKKYAGDPDLNFFIHDAPLSSRNFDFHHWHIEVMPHISQTAGFELSTGIDINTVDPDMAAAILRGKKK